MINLHDIQITKTNVTKRRDDASSSVMVNFFPAKCLVYLQL